MYLHDNSSAQPFPAVEYADDTGSLPGENGVPVSSATVAGMRGLRGLGDDYDVISQRVSNAECATWLKNLHAARKRGSTLYYGEKTAADCVQRSLDNSVFNMNYCCTTMPGNSGSGSGNSGSGTNPGAPPYDSGTPTGGKCEQAGGTCIDTNKYSCSSATKSGYCPGASNIRCCVGTAKMKNGGTIKTGKPTPVPSYPGSGYGTVPSGVNTANLGNGALWAAGGIIAAIVLTKVFK